MHLTKGNVLSHLSEKRQHSLLERCVQFISSDKSNSVSKPISLLKYLNIENMNLSYHRSTAPPLLGSGGDACSVLLALAGAVEGSGSTKVTSCVLGSGSSLQS